MHPVRPSGSRTPETFSDLAARSRAKSYSRAALGHTSSSRGTIQPHQGFDEVEAMAQARRLHSALTRPLDTAAVIATLTHYPLQERKIIEDVYNRHFSPSLQSAVRREFDYNLRATLLALLQWRPQYLAGWARRGLQSPSPDTRLLVELLCGWPQSELGPLERSYRRLHGQSLETALRARLTGDFCELLVALVRQSRDEDQLPDGRRARRLAETMVQAGRFDNAFLLILTGTSYPLLQQVIAVFPSVSGGATVEAAIRAEFGGDLRAGLLALVQCVSNAPAFFADRLHRAMRGLGTDDDALIRILVTRSDTDLEDVKTAYLHRHGKSLADAVDDDTSGFYGKALRAIIK